MRYVEHYDCTLFAPSAESKCDIALVDKTQRCVAIKEAKWGEAMYNDTVQDDLFPGGRALIDVKPLGPAVQTISYMGAAVLPSMRTRYHDGPSPER